MKVVLENHALGFLRMDVSCKMMPAEVDDSAVVHTKTLRDEETDDSFMCSPSSPSSELQVLWPSGYLAESMHVTL